ncbi:MAG: HlyD family efflux transporter periplasmic adaptor subunit [Prevotellaceae bacterium]|jgi:multidrug efflux pump subunit AcrA (membrane-fusion protein)|nr:HlyD family efflux transporter periplasmic adaptor subunit [Prevotellaceae bacterium]
MDIQLKKKHPVVKYKYYILSGVVVIGLIIYILFTMGGPSKLRYDLENLQIAEVTQGKFMEYVDQEGLALPRMTIKINASEAGTVDSIVAEEGSMLKKGDVILILKNKELQRTIDDEKDDLEKKRVSHQERLLQMEKSTSELKRSIMRTVHELEHLTKKYKLDEEEFQMGIKSKAELDIASDEFNFQQKNTIMLLNELKNDSLRNAIQADLMENDMMRDEKKFLRNQERLNNLFVRAPIDGQLGFINAVYGQIIGTGMNIGEQKVISDLKINTKVSEYYIDRITNGLPATVIYQNKKYRLKIIKINPEIKERMFDIDLVFIDEVPDNIRIGKTYRIQIELGQPEDALIMDKGNFYQSTGGQWIFKIDKSGNKAIRTNIIVGRQNPSQYEVLEGLSVGDKVIISGYNSFGDAHELVLK